jgi:fructose-specific phosphotransferase system IIC component
MVTPPPDDSTEAAVADQPGLGAGLRAAVGEDRIVRVDLWATGVFTVVAVGAAVWSGLLVPAVAVDLALFLAGCVAFLYAYFRGIGRSREDAITLAGLFFLAEGAAPRPIAHALRLLLAAQVVVAVATAAARPFSSLAFGILAPMFGLAMLAVWGAVHGRFPPRTQGLARGRPDEA